MSKPSAAAQAAGQIFTHCVADGEDGVWYDNLKAVAIIQRAIDASTAPCESAEKAAREIDDTCLSVEKCNEDAIEESYSAVLDLPKTTAIIQRACSSAMEADRREREAKWEELRKAAEAVDQQFGDADRTRWSCGIGSGEWYHKINQDYLLRLRAALADLAKETR